eukprot:TRINITY_DN18165_c0_g1_i1.p1 TRINITY_DN18165_c0_g1~~TRINITY_DN18165_c0_g1_i1.p1  ORF type:complete len:139 (+),score=18.72 TRINITY_DN18165_c0_g1_i1:328-744(+)
MCTKLVPALKEVERCVDVPKEVCVRSQRNPRKVSKPVIKNWCYKPKCPDDCRLAAREGKCLPECEEYKGDTSCCNPCPAKCIEAAKAKAVLHRNVNNGRMTRSANAMAAPRDARMQLPKVSVLGSVNHSRETLSAVMK